MGAWLEPPEPGETLDMPTVTAPMTGRTVGATTSSSVSPRTSGIFWPKRTGCDDDKKKKKCEAWERSWLKLTEGKVGDFFNRLTGRKPPVTAPATDKTVGNVQIKKAPAPRSVSTRVSSRNMSYSPKDKVTGKPLYDPKPIPMDKHGNMVPDKDYEFAAPHPDAWPTSGKHATSHVIHGLTGEPETPHSSHANHASSGWSSSATPASATPKSATKAPAKHLGSSGDRKMPSDVFTRSHSHSSLSKFNSKISDRIDPAD